MQLKPTGLLHDAHNNQPRVLRLLQNKKIARLVLYFEAKSATEKFDLADTAQSENTTRFSATFHSNALACSLNTFSSAPGASSVDLFTWPKHAYQCFNVHAATKLHTDWHLNWFNLNPIRRNDFDRV